MTWPGAVGRRRVRGYRIAAQPASNSPRRGIWKTTCSQAGVRASSRAARAARRRTARPRPPTASGRPACPTGAKSSASLVGQVTASQRPLGRTRGCRSARRGAGRPAARASPRWPSTRRTALSRRVALEQGDPGAARRRRRARAPGRRRRSTGRGAQVSGGVVEPDRVLRRAPAGGCRRPSTAAGAGSRPAAADPERAAAAAVPVGVEDPDAARAQRDGHPARLAGASGCQAGATAATRPGRVCCPVPSPFRTCSAPAAT